MKSHQFRRAPAIMWRPKFRGVAHDAAPDGDINSVLSTAAARPSLSVVFGILVLGCVLYLPFLSLPFLSDDYLQVTLARAFGPASEWGALLGEPLYRNRVTALIFTYWIDLAFPLSRTAFGLSSMLLHAVNGLLVYGLGSARSIGWQLSALMAVVFVLQERPHEAVIWYSAQPELLLFFFALSSLLLWIQWLRAPGRAAIVWFSVFTCFLLALLSKESVVAVVVLMVVIAALERAPVRRAAAGLFPIALVAIGYALSVFLGHEKNHHFVDGTFALQAGFVKTLLLSAGRGLWVWGWVSLAVLWCVGVRTRLLLIAAFCWILAALLPYSFLDYMETVPSRHHYLAAAGYSMIVAMGLMALLHRTRSSRLIAIFLVIMGLHHTSYLWTSKYRQFEKRSQPIEGFLQFVRSEPRRPIIIHCSDFYFSEVRRAAHLRLGEPEQNFILDFSGGTGESPSYCLPR